MFILISLFFPRSKIAEFHLSTNINYFLSFFPVCLLLLPTFLPLSLNPSLRLRTLLPARFHIYATVHYGFLFLCDVKKNVHVGIEAILHVVREQRAKRVTEMRAGGLTTL